MTVQITPSQLQGTITAIPSKSELHRALICAALCGDPTDILVPGNAYISESLIPDDISATVSCLRALGAAVTFSPNCFHVVPVRKRAISPVLNCRESGSTLRFLLPVAAACSSDPHFSGEGRLPDRPVGEMLSLLEKHGVKCSDFTLPFALSGVLSGGVLEIPGNVSSQYLTGLLLALPLLGNDSEIVLTTELRSSGYIDITTYILSRFGIEIVCDGNRYRVRHGCSYRSPGTVTIGGDWSNTSAFLIAGLLGDSNSITVENLDLSSVQGDREILNIIRSFGYDPMTGQSSVTTGSAQLTGTVIDIDPTPDLMPVLSIAALAAKGSTSFINASRLRLKESDRISSVETLIRSLNGSAESSADTLTVSESPDICGGTVDSFNDHRIVMAAAIASCLSGSPITVSHAEAVRKSYPSFFEDFISLGGTVNVI